MDEPVLQIFNESSVRIPLQHDHASAIQALIESHEKVIFESIELVFVDEEEIVRINKEYLDRNYVTDIISFRYDDGAESQNNDAIEGTLFCCAPRIQEQADEFGESVGREFKRIFIHGLLHLSGYNDQTKDEKSEMTDLEDKYLSLSEENK